MKQPYSQLPVNHAMQRWGLSPKNRLRHGKSVRRLTIDYQQLNAILYL
jgi:hypothetical protein